MSDDDLPLATTLAVVLAGGGGTRFRGDTHKLDADLDGHTIAQRSVRTALDAAIGPVVIVTGAHHPDLGPFEDELSNGDLVVISNPDWADGQSTTLAAAVSYAAQRHAHAIVIGLADQPFLSPRAWQAIAASRWPMAAATYDGALGQPVRLHRSVWPLLPTDGDMGAREVLRLRPDLVEQVPCEGSPADVDTLEDLRSWQNSSSTNSR